MVGFVLFVIFVRPEVVSCAIFFDGECQCFVSPLRSKLPNGGRIKRMRFRRERVQAIAYAQHVILCFVFRF